MQLTYEHIFYIDLSSSSFISAILASIYNNMDLVDRWNTNPARDVDIGSRGTYISRTRDLSAAPLALDRSNEQKASRLPQTILSASASNDNRNALYPIDTLDRLAHNNSQRCRRNSPQKT